MDGAILPTDKAYEPLTTPSKQRKVTVIKRRTTDPKAIQDARNLGRESFSEMGPDGEDALFAFLSLKLKDWKDKLASYQPLADTSDYPGQEEIAEGLQLIDKLLAADDSCKFKERFNSNKGDLLTVADAFHEVEHFYEHQTPAGEQLRKAAGRFKLNRLEIGRDEKAGPALVRIEDILAAASPYGLVKEAEDLIATVDAVNTKLIGESREQATKKIDGHIAAITTDLKSAGGDAALETACVQPLKRLREQVEKSESIAHTTQAEEEALNESDAAVKRIEGFAKKKAARGGKSVVKPQKIVTPADFMTDTYLETKEDVDEFLAKLRKQIEDALDKKERIQIR